VGRARSSVKRHTVANCGTCGRRFRECNPVGGSCGHSEPLKDLRHACSLLDSMSADGDESAAAAQQRPRSGGSDGPWRSARSSREPGAEFPQRSSRYLASNTPGYAPQFAWSMRARKYKFAATASAGGLAAGLVGLQACLSSVRRPTSSVSASSSAPLWAAVACPWSCTGRWHNCASQLGGQTPRLIEKLPITKSYSGSTSRRLRQRPPFVG